ncbi:hypothetical protein CTA2_8403 [Colletotrichum tanaceti]|nr:hypothetical protein CTA2_8403 [Colletotrichum tanaceti]
MASRRKQSICGANPIPNEERLRRVDEAKGHIRETVTYTPVLHGRVSLYPLPPVNYNAEYNRVLRDLYIHCDTEAWKAQGYINSLIGRADSDLLEIILAGTETGFWRAEIDNNALHLGTFPSSKSRTKTRTSPSATSSPPSPSSFNGGKYLPAVYRRLVVKQKSAVGPLILATSFQSRCIEGRKCRFSLSLFVAPPPAEASQTDNSIS